MTASIGINPPSRRPRPNCRANGCVAWQRPCGCGYLGANTPCAHPVQRAGRQAELPTVAAQVDDYEQLQMEAEQ